MPVRSPEGWFFTEGGDRIVCPVVLLSLEGEYSQEHSPLDWIAIEEQVDGMQCNELRAIVLRLPAPQERLDALYNATEGAWEPGDKGWRHDLSWHNTPMDTVDDPTIAAYLRALGTLGLTWTPPAGNISEHDLGVRLAQGVWPLDPTDENLRALGVNARVADLLGREADPERHSIALLAPGDD